MKTVIIENEKFNVEDKVHDLLCFYSDAVQMACLVRDAQRAYLGIQDQHTLKRAKALEKKFDEMLNGEQETNQLNLLK